MPIFDTIRQGIANRRAAKDQRQAERSAQGQVLTSRQSRAADRAISNMSEDELKQAVQNHRGTERDKVRYIEAWIDKHYGNNKDRLASAYGVVESSIGRFGIDDNPIIEYTDKFLQSPDLNSYSLDSDYVTLVNSLIKNGTVTVSTDWLYEPWLYNETVQNNVYKLKALAFVSNRRNVNSYGLKDEGGNPLTIEALKNKTADEMLDILEKSQTKNFGNERDSTFRQEAEENKNASQNELDYFRDVLRKASPENVEVLDAVLQAIFKDNYDKRTFLYQETSSNTFQKDVVKYLQNYLRENPDVVEDAQRQSEENERRERINAFRNGYKVSDWLAEHRLNPVDIFNEFTRDIPTKVSKNRVAKYREYLREILKSTTWLRRLLDYNVENDTREAMVNSLVSFLNSFHEIVKRENNKRKAEADVTAKPEVKQLMNDVVDALVGLQFTRQEAITKFKDNYEPGISENDLLQKILRNHETRDSES